ncbi:VWA domain-containing protein [Myxococcota bacterium]|jgi:hypothetical protein|nr:VWA domain-containing protein [Myxococcota bacterium]
MSRLLGRPGGRSVLGLVALAILTLTACNYRWIAVLSTFQFNRLEIVSVFPAHRGESGNYQRQCTPEDRGGARTDALLFSVAMIGTEVGTATDPSEKDNDTAIRPGDLVKKGRDQRAVVEVGNTVTESLFQVDLECFEPYPDEDLKTTAQCQGLAGPRNATPQKIDYRSYYEGEYRPAASDREALSLAVLIDQSGSMKGFVEPETGLEAKDKSNAWDSQNFKDHASDSDGQRVSAVRSLFSLLNPGDRAGVFQYGEAVGLRPTIVCDDIYGATEEEKRRNCFGTNRTVITESRAFSKLVQSPGGRTPLWAAVKDIYEFMKTSTNSRVRHILVINDGPDTCHPDSPDFQPVLLKKTGSSYREYKQNDSCSDVSFEDFLATLEQDLKDSSGNWLDPERVPVHISFIQFQAQGYRERDARQQEIACRTGGHYLFLNSWDFSRVEQSQGDLLTALTLVAQRFRSVMAGAWVLALDVADLANNRLWPGAQVATGGSIKMIEGPVNPNAQQEMRVGYVDPTATGRNIPKWDTRLAFRVPCAAGDSCDWRSQVGTCETVGCRSGDRTCVTDWKADQTSCQGGGTSQCCFGQCRDPGPCKTLNALCNPVNVENGTPCDGGTCTDGVCQ